MVHAEQYAVPLFVTASPGGDPQGVLRLVSDAETAGTVAIHAIDDAGSRIGPITLELNPWAAVEFTASELQSGNTAKGLASGLGSLAGDVRLVIDSDVAIVPSAYVRSGDGALSTVHDTVIEARDAGTYRYDVAIFHPAANAPQQSRLRLINPGEGAARLTIAARDDTGATATGGTVELTLPGGGAQTLTAQQLEAGDPAVLTGRLGAGVGNWRLSVMSDRPIQAVNVTVGTGGDWNNLSTTAVSGWAPEDEVSFEARFLERVIVSRDGLNRLEQRVLAEGRIRVTVRLADGGEVIEEGGYGFERTGRDAGLLTLRYDSGRPCTVSIFFDSPTSGWYASSCVDAADAVEDRGGGSWWALDAGAAPLDLGSGLDDMTYTVGTAIDVLTLPAPTGGGGGPTYSLSPEVPGLTFDAAARELTGTPTESGAWLMTYRVRDASGDSDWRYFNITVGTDTGGGETTHGVGDTLTDLPTGSWTPDVTTGGSFSSSAGNTTVNLNEGGYIEEGGHRYTCQSTGGCVVENRRVTSGTVVQTASGTAPGSGIPGDHGDDQASATEVAADSDTQGDLTSGDVDYFRVVVNTAGTLEAYTTGRTDTLGWLEDADGAVLGRNDDGGAGTNFQISEDVTPGTYYVRVAGYSSRVTGDYTLHVRFTGSGTDDRAALMALYNATDGPNWTINENWGSDAPLDQWHGVATDDSGRVTNIDLSDNQLSGPISAELGNLANLEWLNLTDNQLTGPIPVELGDLSNLTFLSLGRNQLTGLIPVELGSLSNLGALWLFGNQLSGAIPKELGSLSSLGVLYLDDNQLSGSIPVELGNLSNLNHLSLRGNQLSGCIPDGLLDVATNDLSTLGLAYCGDSGTPGGGQETTHGVGDMLTDLPTGFWNPDVTSGGSFLFSGGNATVRLNDGGYIEEGGFRYTCQSSGGCVIENRSVTSGTVVQTASGTAPGEGSGQGPRPSFPAGSGPGDQTYTVDTAIAALTLPEASGGDGPLTYSLSPTVPGLTFNATASVRRLTGTPTAAGTYDITYTVRDVDGDTDSLTFAITVENAGDGGSSAGDFVLDEDNRWPTGIAFANERFYVVDRVADKVYAYTASGERDASADFDLDRDNSFPEGVEGIAFANGRFYVVDEFIDKVYAYTASGQRDASADFDLDSTNGYPQGITFANGRFYVVDSFDAKVYAYTASGQRDAAADFSLVVYNGSATGIAFADGRFYVVDSGQNEVYAYTASGQSDAAAYFYVYSVSGNPFGIVFANGRFYIVNWRDAKVYAYTASGERVVGDGSSAGAPDLVVQSASVSDASPSAGASFTLSATVRNDGDGDAPTTTLRYYRSSNATISRSDTQVGTDSVSGLSASRTSAESISLTAPSSAGTYYYGACVDSVTGESDTDNNCSSGVRVTVSSGETGGGGNGNCVEVNDVIELGDGESCTITQALVDKYSLNSVSVRAGDTASCSGGRVTLSFFSGASIHLNGLTIRCR